MSKERKRSWDGELSDDNDDIKKVPTKIGMIFLSVFRREKFLPSLKN